jgi:hypothetical protein
VSRRPKGESPLKFATDRWARTLSCGPLPRGPPPLGMPTGLFIQTLNEMIYNQGKRLAALRNRVPNVVPLVLFGIAAVASAFAGYASGFEAKRNRLPVYTTGVVVGKHRCLP